MEKLISKEELGDFLGKSPATLDNWRGNGTGPPYIKVGGSVRYKATDVENWLSTATVQTERARASSSNGSRTTVRRVRS